MKNKKLVAVLEGIIIIMLGILVAVCGITTAIDIYFGVVATVAGAALLLFSCFLMSKKAPVAYGLLALAGASLAVGIGLFTNFISFGVLIPLLLLVVMGAAAALILHGLYDVLLNKKLFFFGVGQMAVGAGVVALCAVYMAVPDFAKVFWIIVGILIALYGAFLALMAAMDKAD